MLSLTLFASRCAAPVAASCWVLLCVLLGVVQPAPAGWLYPVEGVGNFRFTCDVMTAPCDDGTADVAAVLSIANRDLTFVTEAGRSSAQVRVTLRLVGTDGTTNEAVTTKRLHTARKVDADSPTLRQEFVVVLRGVVIPVGTCEVMVEDLQRRRPGLNHVATDRLAYALAVADWHAPARREARGLAIGDAVYLSHAPIRRWSEEGRLQPPGLGGPWDYVNPGRRYGLGCESVQFYATIEPPQRVEDRQRAATRSILVRIESDHLDFALVDTIITTDAVRRALVSGRTAAVYWEMDAGGLPPGEFRLGLAPIDTVGRGLLSTFSVVWRLEKLARRTDDLLGEGRTVLYGADREAFESASPVEQGLILDEFWRHTDPTPGDRYNEALAEFRRRVEFVRNYLGGFGAFGAKDPRGRVYLVLGSPDSAQEEAMPLNEIQVEDARRQVYERYRPEQIGSFFQGVDGAGGSSYSLLPGSRPYSNPIPYSYTADKVNRAKRSGDSSRGFLLWRYDQGGSQLFHNSYSGRGGGMQFLFIDRLGKGEYVLDSDNTWLEGD